MLQMQTDVHRNVQKRLRQTVLVVLQLAVLEFDGLFRLVLMDERDFGHQTSLTFFPARASRTLRFITTSAS